MSALLLIQFVKQPLLFRHASSPLLFAARGRRRLLHSRPPCERACGTPGARCTPGPDADAVVRKVCIRTFGKHGRLPDVPPAVFCRLADACPSNRSRSPLFGPARQGRGSTSYWAGRVSNLVVRHLIRGPVPSASKPSRLSQWYPDHRRCGLPADSRYPHIP